MTFDELMHFANGNDGIFTELVKNCMSSAIWPVVGAGLSVDFGYPDWKNLLLTLIHKIDNEETSNRLKKMAKGTKPDYEAIAQEIAKIRGDNLIYHDIQRIFSEEKLIDVDFRGKAVDILPYLFTDIITTNFDCVIENVFAAQRKPGKVMYVEDQELMSLFLKKHPTHAVLKLHGDIYSKQKDLIFTKDSYDRQYGKKDSKLNRSLYLMINAKKLLFIGSSLQQDRLAKHLIKLGNGGNDHFAIMECDKQNIDEERNRLSDYHINNVIFYPTKQYECVTIILEKLLECVYPDIYKQCVENNTISPVAANYVIQAKNIQEEEFMTPTFKMSKNDGNNQSQFDGLSDFFNIIDKSTECCFWLVDYIPKDKTGICGGGGMGKTTVLAKTYYYNRPKTLFFTLKEYKKDSGIKDQIVSRCKTGRENWILFDGLNEMNENDFISFNVEISEAFNKIKAVNGSTKFIFSARNAKIFENLHEAFRKAPKIVFEIWYKPETYEEYYKKNNIQPDKELKKILRNPLFVSLYAKTKRTLRNITGDITLSTEFSNLIKDEKLYNSGEILYNYILSQKFNYINEEDKDYINRIIFEFLPKLAHKMRDYSRQSIMLNDCRKIINTSEKEIHAAMTKANRGLNLIHYSENAENRNENQVSFVHEEFLDFFEAVYLVQKVNNCRTQNLLHYPDNKNPIDNARKYYVEILDGFKIEHYLNDRKNLPYRERKEYTIGCAVAAECLGDLFYYKHLYGYKSRFTAEIDNSIDLMQKATEYYKEEAEFGDPLGYWNLSLVYRDMLKLAKSETEKKKIEEIIYLCSEKALKGEKDIINGLPDIEQYYKPIGESAEKFYSRIACMENSIAIAYNYGYGTKRDLLSAKDHFRHGIRYQYAYSYNRLAQMYENEVKDIMHALLNGTVSEDEANKKLIITYVTAFIIFWKQIQDVEEKYGMNRLSWYVYDGISIKPEYAVDRNFKLLKQISPNEYCLKFLLEWVKKYMDQCPELGLFSDDPNQLAQLRKDASTNRLKEDVILWMHNAAFSGDSYAIDRMNRVKTEESKLNH